MPPFNEHHQTLMQNLHPPDWVNPKPSGKYNLVVLGGGTAGLVTAAIASALGAKVALVERNLMGGDCLNTGCVPSKGILRVSRGLGEMARSRGLGIRILGEVHVDFARVMERMQRLRAKISFNDSVKRFKNMGVDVFLGEGKFIEPKSIEVSGKILKFSKAAVCTGARPGISTIPGLDADGVLTSENIFSLTELPETLAVIGAGPIGSEMTQAFARFGSQVFLFESSSHILPREDEDAAMILQERLKNEGVRLLLGSKILSVESRENGKVIHYQLNGEKKELTVQKILVSIGRTPNVEGLGLENAGIEFDTKEGIKVNQKLQTTNSRVYAAGDVCFPFKFTHAADATAQILIQNALFPHPLGLGYASTGDLIIPRCTYTDPEIAHVGRVDEEMIRRKGDVETLTVLLNEIDRAILDGEEEGFVRVHLEKGTDRIIGATLVGSHAGEMISEMTVAINSGAGLGLIGRTIHPYPTQSDAFRKVATAWRKKGLTQTKKKVLTKWFSLFR
ncbi:MAG: mercuric reductase [Nitrospiria bacterium]